MLDRILNIPQVLNMSLDSEYARVTQGSEQNAPL